MFRHLRSRALSEQLHLWRQTMRAVPEELVPPFGRAVRPLVLIASIVLEKPRNLVDPLRA